MENCQFLFLFSKLGKGILDFSFSSRNWRKEFRFLFLLSKLSKKIRDFSFSSRDEAKEFGFLFLFSKLRNGIQISLSPLECGEIVFKFLFLFSIGLFCISSMTVLRPQFFGPSHPPKCCKFDVAHLLQKKYAKLILRPNSLDNPPKNFLVTVTVTLAKSILRLFCSKWMTSILRRFSGEKGAKCILRLGAGRRAPFIQGPFFEENALSRPNPPFLTP